MVYLTAKEFCEKWGISERRIIRLCQENRIDGAIKNGGIWNIPADTVKPMDQRSNIVQYISTEKRVMIVNMNTEIGYLLIPLLEKYGYRVEGICEENAKLNSKKLNGVKVWQVDFENRESLKKVMETAGKYYDGLILIDDNLMGEEWFRNKEWLIIKMAQKLDFESSVVLVNNSKGAKMKLEEKLAKKSKEKIGFRVNSVNIDIPMAKQIFVNYDEIAKDVCTMFTGFKNTTGMAISTDGGFLTFDEKGRTAGMKTGLFYRAIHQYFQKLDKESHLWCASTMLEDEWTEEPLEMNFRLMNLEAANRGVKIERIFIFCKSEIEKYKNNKTLKIYMQSNIHTLFVDYYEILEKEPELLKIVGDGWDGINRETLIVDLPEGSRQRGYISENKREVNKAYECFQRLKEYAKDLREVLKGKGE